MSKLCNKNSSIIRRLYRRIGKFYRVLKKRMQSLFSALGNGGAPKAVTATGRHRMGWPVRRLSVSEPRNCRPERSEGNAKKSKKITKKNLLLKKLWGVAKFKHEKNL